jgi:predicted nucleotidyltransferase
MVPGLGTRAVDRVSDDYPILASPGQPNLKVNVTLDEMVRYSPQKIDVINLETNQFETVSISNLINEIGDSYPSLTKVFSTIKNNILSNINAFSFNPRDTQVVATFNRLFTNSDFLLKVKTILNTLKDKLNTPVDIEFAYNNDTFYLLQCRPQSFAREWSSDSIPKDVPDDQVIFSANKYVSNGKVPEITFAVLVNPKKYSEIEDRQTLLRVGRAVGKINKILPKRKFILIGPGRWGSRGDIKLGVNVTYSDINNTAMLIEVAIKKGNYLPDLSFGTHFFQDLVEASIRYLPLYPDEQENKFNWKFFNLSDNILAEITPEFENLKDIVKVIDIKKSTNNKVLKILINAELDEALALIVDPNENETIKKEKILYRSAISSNHWRWRYKMAEKIASQIDSSKYGVKHIYVFGSTKNGIAGPESDIDLLIHVENDKNKKVLIDNWLKGWSLALSEMNYLRTGYKTEGLLDLHYVTDEDIKNKTSFALKIGAVTDAASELEMMKN